MPTIAVQPVEEGLAAEPAKGRMPIADGQRLNDRQGVRQTARQSVRLYGLQCAACATLVERALMSVPGVTHAQASAAGQTATVTWEPSAVDIATWQAAVRRAGYRAEVAGSATARESRRELEKLALWRLFVAGFCAMQVMMMAAPAYFSAPGELAPDLARLLNWAAWLLTVPVMLFSAAPLFRSVWRDLRLRRVGMDLPVVVALTVSFWVSTSVTLVGAGSFGGEVYFDSITMFVSFLLLSRWIQLRMAHRAAQRLEDAAGDLPSSVQRMDELGRLQTVDVSQLCAGDQLLVPKGEAFAADGVILQGKTQVSEALLTGESTPIQRAIGDNVIAGSVNLGAPVLMRAQQVGEGTRYAAIVALTNRALSQRAGLESWSDEWALPFLCAVFALSATAYFAWSFIDPTRALGVALAVMVVTCPCALSLAAPATLVAAMGHLASKGVLVQRVAALEVLGRVNVVLTDKTGTLSDVANKDLSVNLAAQAAAGMSMQAGLLMAASLAQCSTHPVARAVVQLAAAHGSVPAMAKPEAGEWRQVEELTGLGLQGLDSHGARWRLGSPCWAVESSAQLSGEIADIAGARVVLAREGRAQLIFDAAECLRPGAAQAVAAMQARGAKVHVISGDSARRVRRTAQLVGADSAFWACGAEAKLAQLKQTQLAGGFVAMVGDGVNDAPVLAAADVSFAMGQGALVARQSADFVVLSGQVSDVVLAMDVAEKARRIVRQNLAWAAVYNASCVPLAMLGYLPPWAAGAGMALSSLGVVLNAARAARTAH